MKRCPRCKDTLPITAFGKNKSRTSGLANWCKSCMLEARKNHNPLNYGKKLCACCRMTRNIEMFKPDKSRPSGYAPRCDDCMEEQKLSKYKIDQSSEISDWLGSDLIYC